MRYCGKGGGDMSQFRNTNLTWTGPISNPGLGADRPTAQRLNKNRGKNFKTALIKSKDSFPVNLMFIGPCIILVVE